MVAYVSITNSEMYVIVPGRARGGKKRMHGQLTMIFRIMYAVRASSGNHGNSKVGKG